MKVLHGGRCSRASGADRHFTRRFFFTAEQPQTRQLIADAQPRLNELAESRGIRIAQSTIDAGTEGQAQSRQPAPQQSATPAAPPRATAESTDDAADARVA